MRLTSSGTYTRPAPVPKMPAGLVELMEGLARDVLKNNPSNVYEFCASHMEKLLEIRDGPSSKKFLTLDQKILKAQEKVRQRAKERQERFDKEKDGQANKSNETTAQIQTDHLIQENLVVPSLKAPVHHEHDLNHASEVEISHVPRADMTTLSEVSDGSKVDQLNVIEEDVHLGLENKSVETIAVKEPFDGPIFGLVEIEEINPESLKEPEIREIAGQEENVESHLQTITEASDENPASEFTAILPEIIIGDDNIKFIPVDIAEESFQKMQPDVINEMKNENFVEMSSVKATEVLKPTDLLHTTERSLPAESSAEHESVTLNSPLLDEENILAESNNDEEQDNINVKSTDNEKQLPNSESVEVVNVPISTNITDTDKDSNDGNDEKISGELSNVSAEEMHKNDSPILEIPLVVLPKDDEMLDEEKNIGESHEIVDEKQNIQILNTSFENTSLVTGKDTAGEESAIETIANKESKAENEHVGSFEILNHDSAVKNLGLDDVKTKSDNIQHKEENEGMDNHNEKCHNSTDILLQKSDSAENTNEDSISMLESDLSKTDDDSTQNNTNMDLETAAVTIQKVFRSFMFKSRNSTFEDNTNDDHNSIDEDNDKKEEYYAAANLNKERRPLGITRMDTVLQTVNEEKSLSLSTDDSSTLSSAATTIQAHVRGFLARNRLNSSKTFSMNSLVNSHEALETDSEHQKNKTILNIHIVPEEGNYLSRDESLITSMDLSLDSPPSSVNLHPLSYDTSERRKMLKREDAVQSVTPPSNNSGKLSEDSVKEVLIDEKGVLERELTDEKIVDIEDQSKDYDNEISDVISSASTVTPITIITISKSEDPIGSPRENTEGTLRRNGRSFTKMSSDESDVITPFVPSPRSSEDSTRLLHSGEFHDVVLPTKVSRNDTSVVREFTNVLVYFLLWNHS